MVCVGKKRVYPLVGEDQVERPAKERRAGVALTSEGPSAQKPIRLGWERRKNVPPPEVSSPAGVVDWTDQPYSDPRLSPRACLNRQAGFTAARPAANWIPASASAWKTPTYNPETSG